MSDKNDKVKILVVDDEENIRELLVEVLSFEGYETEEAEDGNSAIEKIEQKNYDLVITDLIMPDVDGLEVLKRAKELYPDIVVLLMTGQATMESAISSLKLGANDFITKPFEITPLIQTLEKNLLNQKLKRENVRLLKQTQEDRDKLKELVSELEILQSLSLQFSHKFDISHMFSLILESFPKILSFDFAAAVNIDVKQVQVHSKKKLGKKIMSWFYNEVCTVLKKEKIKLNIEKDFDLVYLNEKRKGELNNNIEDKIIIPLYHDKTIFGILVIASFTKNSFIDKDIEFLNKIANQTSEIFSRLQLVTSYQKQRLQIIIDSIPDGVVIYNESDNEIQFNPIAKDIIKHDKETGLYEHVENLFNIKFSEFIDQLKNDKKPIIKEIKVDEDNKQLIFAANVAGLLGSSGDVQGLVMVLRDVTREREIEQLKKEFISNVSHELRTPAAIVKEFISIMKDEIAGPVTEGQAEYLDTMTNNIERLLRLIENLLNMSRIESGRIKVKRNWFDPNLYLTNITNSLRVRLKTKEMKLILDKKDELPMVYADPDAFTQILTNLIENARKFSEDKTTVTVKAEIVDKDILFSVKDQGKGIPKEHLDKVFERFHRIENEEDIRQEGAGLGLPIIKELINQHSGKVWAESELKKGSTFFFTLNQTEYIENPQKIG